MILDAAVADRGIFVFAPEAFFDRDQMLGLPAGREPDIVVLDPFDPTYSFGFNPLRELQPPLDLLIELIHDGLGRIPGPRLWYPECEEALRAVLNLQVSTASGTLLDTAALLVDRERCLELASASVDPDLRRYWLGEDVPFWPFTEIARLQALSQVITSLLAESPSRWVLGQGRSTIDLGRFSVDRKIVLVHTDPGNFANRLLTGMLLYSALQALSTPIVSYANAVSDGTMFVSGWDTTATPSLAKRAGGAQRSGVPIAISVPPAYLPRLRTTQRLLQVNTVITSSNDAITEARISELSGLRIRELEEKLAGPLPPMRHPTRCLTHDPSGDGTAQSLARILLKPIVEDVESLRGSPVAGLERTIEMRETERELLGRHRYVSSRSSLETGLKLIDGYLGAAWKGEIESNSPREAAALVPIVTHLRAYLGFAPELIAPPVKMKPVGEIRLDDRTEEALRDFITLVLHPHWWELDPEQTALFACRRAFWENMLIADASKPHSAARNAGLGNVVTVARERAITECSQVVQFCRLLATLGRELGKDPSMSSYAAPMSVSAGSSIEVDRVAREMAALPAGAYLVID